MDDLRTRAQLVAFDRAGSIGTLVTRAEIAEAAAGDAFPATLLLDLDRVEAADGGEVTARARVAVDWDEETLNRLLASTEGQELQLWFDERELVRAFDELDVEGHGLRQRAAVLAVAVAAAGASSTPALARTVAGTGGVGGSAPAAVSVTATSVGGAERALAQDEKLSQGLSSGQAPATGVSVQAVPVGGAERALQQDEKLSPTQGPGAVTSEPVATTTSTLSAEELAAAVAGGLLLISAAGFGVARRRTPPARPA